MPYTKWTVKICMRTKRNFSDATLTWDPQQILFSLSGLQFYREREQSRENYWP